MASNNTTQSANVGNAGASTGSKIKAGWHKIHGAGEALRGEINSFADSTLNSKASQGQGMTKSQLTTQNGLNEMNAGSRLGQQSSVGQTGVGQTGVGQTGVGQTGVGQTGVGQTGVGQTGVGHTGVGHGQNGIGQTGVGNVGSQAEYGAPNSGFNQVGTQTEEYTSNGLTGGQTQSGVSQVGQGQAVPPTGQSHHGLHAEHVARQSEYGQDGVGSQGLNRPVGSGI